MLTYSGNRRFTKILDLFTFKFKSKGPIYCMPLIFIICVGKQNQYSCFKTIGILQNKKPLIYMLNGLAF